jgi:hypothetical protein
MQQADTNKPASAVWKLVFDMEDDIRAARDWARLLFDRLSEINALVDSDESDAFCRAALELSSATQRTCDASSCQETSSASRNG